MNPLAMLRQMRAIKDLLTEAEREARAMGEVEPGAEHLLLAAMDLGDGTAARAMERFEVDRDRLRAAIAEHHAAALASVGVDPAAAAALAAPQPLAPPDGDGIYRSGASAQEAFRAAGALARRDRRFLGAHVVIAVAEMEAGTSTGVLERLGVDRAALAGAARAELARGA